MKQFTQEDTRRLAERLYRDMLRSMPPPIPTRQLTDEEIQNLTSLVDQAFSRAFVFERAANFILENLPPSTGSISFESQATADIEPANIIYTDVVPGRD